MIHRVDLVGPSFCRYCNYINGPCDVCVTPVEVREYDIALSKLVWVRLCDEHLPVADLLKAARALQDVASCG